MFLSAWCVLKTHTFSHPLIQNMEDNHTTITPSCLLLQTESSKHEIIIWFDAKPNKQIKSMQIMQFDLSENMCWQLHFISTDPVIAFFPLHAHASFMQHEKTSDKSLCHGCVDACEDGSDERVPSCPYFHTEVPNQSRSITDDGWVGAYACPLLVMKERTRCGFLHIPPRTTCE